MVVEEREGSIAIVTNGGGGYLVVEIIGEALTYSEAKELMQDTLEEEEEEEPEEDEEGEEDERD